MAPGQGARPCPGPGEGKRCPGGAERPGSPHSPCWARQARPAVSTKVCFGLNVPEKLNVTGGQSPGPWQPADAVAVSASLPCNAGCLHPSGFWRGEDMGCGGLPRDQHCPLALAALELLLRLRLRRLCWMQPWAQRWCHPHGASPGWNGAGVGSPR